MLPVDRLRSLGTTAGLALALAAAGCTGEIGQPLVADRPTPSTRFFRSADPIPGQYIVVLANPTGVRTIAMGSLSAALSIDYPMNLEQELGAALPAMIVSELTEADALALSEDERVAFVEEDGRVSASTVQANATFGLDRIDQPRLPLDGVYDFPNQGTGVNAYVIDTGIRASHLDLGGRVRADFTAVNDGRGTDDCAGHGTHVAGTIGSRSFGVAKDVTLHAVRVLGCDGNGSLSQVLAGIDYVAHSAVKPAVANMSLGMSVRSPSIDRAVQAAIASGVTFVLAAGNASADACGTSPAGTPEAITVGATSSNDARAGFSNFGSCVDLFAPGDGITSTFNTSDSATAVLSGTSMASPHVAGAAALYLAAHPGASPAEVVRALTDNAGVGVVLDPQGSPDRLLDIDFLSGGTPPPPPGPDGEPQQAGASDQLVQGQEVRYVALDVVPGSDLTVAITGSGDPDLYVQFGAPPVAVDRPTMTDHLCAPFVAGAGESCAMTVPSDASQAFIMVHGFTAATYSLTAAWLAPQP